jgi:DNA-binding MarR family transcriptional regulator
MIDYLNKLLRAMPAATQTDVHPTGSPVDEVWSLLRTLFGQQRRQFLIAAAEAQLQPAQAGALLQLDAPRPMHELADLLACDNSNVTGLIDRLEARGLVVRRPGPDDRRVRHVVLTARGRRLRERLLRTVGRPLEGFKRLSSSEQRQLRDLLRHALEDLPGS